jgi:hypothetical protein
MYLYHVDSLVYHPRKHLEGPELRASGTSVESGDIGDGQAPARTFYTPPAILGAPRL